MKHRKSNHLAQPSGLSYQLLEPRQLLTVLVANHTSHHLPEGTSRLIVSNLDSAPEIVSSPEHGSLNFDDTNGTLTYTPADGFTGKDSFTWARQGQLTNTDSIRVWESTYAVPDWVHVKPGKATSVAALDNDYSFRDTREQFAVDDPRRHSRHDSSWQQDSSELRIVEFVSSSGATISISEDGKLLNYTSASGFSGEDLVTYILENPEGHRSEGIITFDVSDQAPEGRYFVSEAQFQQQRIENWMERYATSLIDSAKFLPRYEILDNNLIVRRFEALSFANTNSRPLDQPPNVQGGDIVKSHGDLLYYATLDDGSGEFSSYLSIVDVSDPNDPRLISTTGFNRDIKDIYLDDDRAAVVLEGTFQERQYEVRPASHRDVYSIDRSSFQILVLDVSDTAVPTEIYRANVNGNYTNASLIGDQLFVVGNSLKNRTSLWQMLRIGTLGNATSPGDFIDAIQEQDSRFDIPTITVSSGGSTESITIGHDQIVNRDDAHSTTLVTVFDLQSDTGTPTDIDLIPTNSVSTVYVSNESMYLFDGTSVIKMDFLAQDAGTEFVADGQLGGRLVSQFAADEHNGQLRVVINDTSNQSSDVLVFEQVDNSLVLTSSLRDIAPGERVYSVSFQGDKAYVVTFRRIDPLFVIDLSDPSGPKIAGELKTTGFSNYLQWIGDGLLLAVGRDATFETGHLGQFGALQISLFDVSDSSNPQLLDRYSFEGDRHTHTPLIKSQFLAPDQNALTFDSKTGTLALPIFSEFDWRSQWKGTGQEIFTGENSAVSLFTIDRKNGIQTSGQVNFESKALRTVIVGDSLVYLSEKSIKAASRILPTEVLASMEIPIEDAQSLTLRPPLEENETPIASVEQEAPIVQPLSSNLNLARRVNFVGFNLARTVSLPGSSSTDVTNSDWTEVSEQETSPQLAAATRFSSQSLTDAESHEPYEVSDPVDDSTIDQFFAGFEDGEFESDIVSAKSHFEFSQRTRSR
ncbi:beta-propeller domain-containing protein [bacterium]|nr:beta-propeller domain-containing protein [bacterium]